MRNIKVIKAMRLSLLLAMLSVGLSVTAQSSKVSINFGEVKLGYSKIKVSFGGEYKPNLWIIEKGDDDIHFTPEALDIAIDKMEATYLKAVKWDSIANSENIPNLTKEMDGVSFATTSGWIYDSGYESVGSHRSKTKYEKFSFNTSDGEFYTGSKFVISIFQAGEYAVRSSRFVIKTYINYNSEPDSEKQFLEFINLLKTSRDSLNSIINKKESESSKFN